MKQGACALLALFCLITSTQTAGAEVLSGTVKISSAVRKVSRVHRRSPLRAQSEKRDYASRGETSKEDRDEVRSVVISIQNAPKSDKKIGGRMLQKNKTFVPFVLPVTAGSKVDFPNNDKIYHGVYSESKAKSFELPQYADGESRSVKFETPGVVELFCHIHAHMNAYIVVLDTPYFAQPDEKHNFKIENLPPGKYTVKAWHPRLGTKVHQVGVKKGSGGRLDLEL